MGTKSQEPIRTSRAHQENIRKVAVTMHGQQALFMELDQNRPLAAIIQDICEKWNLQNVDDYSIQFSEPTRKYYITERNRGEIQNGNVLQLTNSPAKTAQTIIEKLKDGRAQEKLESLKTLSDLSSDATFAQEFINKQGLTLIIGFVVGGKFQGEPLALLLKSFVSLMDHNIVSWDILDADFTKQVTSCLSTDNARYSMCLQPALEILESVILHTNETGKHASVEEKLTPDKIIPYLKSSNADVQKSAIALLNAMFSKATGDQRTKIADNLMSKNFRTVLITNVFGGHYNVGPEMAHQLYVLQTLLMNMYEARMNKPVNPQDESALKQIEELRRIAFDFSDPGDPGNAIARKSTNQKDYRKLGFEHESNPIEDFLESPPGLLALDNMIHFAQVHKESYIKVVLENSGRSDEHDCPFVQGSIQLTKVLCDMLKIGEQPWEEEQTYYPMLFSVERPLEEFFSICIQVLNKTWRDMKASILDLQKVILVVKEQVTRALDKHQMPKTFESFRQKLSQLNYPEIKKIWDSERMVIDEMAAQAQPILELREKIKPEIMELIALQRLNVLEEGSRFPKFDSRGVRTKNKYQFWRLSPNHKAFHYGDCNENDTPSIEQLQNKGISHC
ncbi:hypothetical protein ACJMK2_009667 [Sinanodonta woodiana]|uniref:ELMO domain-containing protein n=1 Tax=Sinanodonta woodiana TaxID=1069815 RepID=A0ABD3VFX6_SINWO